MKKWITLILLTVLLIAAEQLLASKIEFHPAYLLMVMFFAIQTFVLFRMESWAPKEWSTQVSLVKVVLRLLSSLIFILVLMYTQTDLFNLVVQFIILYLVYMIFEIVMALTNLRRN
ncbi:hypothetical protein [Ekhidna sp.]|uniref:hypothetical protein n=1 Tax=Ekhidna sp. TaxID=2608089 RepID=UPI003515C17D